MTTLPRLTFRETARGISDLFCLWRCCGKPGCRRARACRGDARSCLTALPLVTTDAVAFLKAMDEGRGWLSFDELIARHEDEWAAVEQWRERVLSTLPENAAPPQK